MHIAQGVLKAINVNKMIASGCRVKIWIADWFAQLNNKMGGDLEKIEIVGKYFIEIWRSIGMDLDSGKVEFLWSSKEINARSHEYWPRVTDIVTKNKLPRIVRCSQIMGRTDQDELTSAQIFYPIMQCADIFFLQADICQLGMDQRKVNVLAREYCDDIKKKNKPIILSHHMLPGLQQGQEKMSKSNRSSSIFMEDEEVEVNTKIENAYCPPEKVEGNPCLEYVQYLILPWFHEFTVECSEKNGGNMTFTDFKDLSAAYAKGEVCPGDLKPSLAKALNKILEPVRSHFKNNEAAKQILQSVKMAIKAPEQLVADEVKEMSIADEVKSVPVVDSQLASCSSQSILLSLDERYKLLRGIAEECIQDDELKNLLANKAEPICYDGFEPSGRMHIAQGILKAINVNKMTTSGCRVKIWIADWFAQLNNKMGGDLKKIETVGKYFIEIWRSVGMNLNSGKVEFLWSAKEINARSHEYWPCVMDIAMKNKLPRIIRCSEIMGRTDQEELAAQIFYPCMQCADIFLLEADICQMGMDQREVNILAREYCDDIKKKNKPIILSHHMLPGLQQGQEKMSTSDPSSSIFMDDEEAIVNTKIKKAYCPPKEVEGNPCLEYLKYLIFPWFHEFTVERSEKNGGNKNFTDFEDLSVAYAKGDVHPGDLKPSLAKALNQILEPVRSHFKNDKAAKQLLQSVKNYKVTR
ncbi:tyrosine--tRNA ligase 1, cytoplasmic isoform X1 [Argentina anserina]|uniref:tyrosine--tRNA ligase 1, cytoplasmic isoform X1 n=1 Tax=Argentina anserina TaxID=57926 RepID=UPI0021766887|nr:tyrosine--tRNA ligase 1, cytoplasmic-like isoform X1 [Potentilla anserina]